VASLAFTIDDSILYSVGCDTIGNGGPCSAAEFLAWDVTTTTLLTPSISGPRIETWNASFDSNGQLAFLGSADEGLIFSNPAYTGPAQEPRSLPVPLINAYSFHPDKGLLATAHCSDADLAIPLCLQSTLTLWNWPDLTIQMQFPNAHAGLTENLVFSADGRTLATVGEDGVIVLWEFDEGHLIPRQLNKANEVVDDALAISSDGSLVAGAGCIPDETTEICSNGATWIWEVESGQQVKGPLLNDEAAFYFGLTFSPDDRFLVSTDGQGDIIFWDIATGNRYIEISAHTGPITAVKFSNSGRFLATGGIDATINLFNLDSILAQYEQSSTELIDRACARAGRNLSQEEWIAHFGDTPYRSACPEFLGPRD
jgi:WD40 repeat protein